jgi:catechol 2,3-dioxygenase-like lactoylglutathione lyase family enzyme
MEVNGLDLLFLEVNSLEESLSFYKEQLGLDVLTHMPEAEPPMATIKAGRTRITLVQQPETMLRRGRGCHFFFSVTDVDAFYRLLTTRGVDLKPPADEGWGASFVTLEDPDKYRLFFVMWDEGG